MAVPAGSSRPPFFGQGIGRVPCAPQPPHARRRQPVRGSDGALLRAHGEKTSIDVATTSTTAAAPATAAATTNAAAATGAIDQPRARSIAELQERLAERSAAIRDALLGGELVQEGVLGSSGITGPPQLLRVSDPSVGEVRAIGKNAAGTYPIAEEFAVRMANRLGIGHLVAPTVERDERVVMALVPGVQARQAGVNDAKDLEQALQRFYANRLQGVSRAAIADQARIDRQLVQVLDHALAIADRHGRNILVDDVGGAVTLIDHSELLLGHDARRPLEPLLMRGFQAGRGARELHPVVQLDDDVRALVAERMPRGTVDELLRDLRARPDFGPATAGRLADEEAVASITARLEDVAERGQLRSTYKPAIELLMERGGNLIDDHAMLRRLIGFLRR